MVPALIPPEQLYAQLVRADAPRLIDVSLDEDVAVDPFVLPTATRLPHTALAEETLDHVPYVVICQKGLKLSQGGAALLRSRGIPACALQGGNIGWREAGLPRVRIDTCDAPSQLFAAEPNSETLTSAWLLRRFLLPDARILWVDPAQADAVCERYAATPLPATTVLLQRLVPEPVEVSAVLADSSAPSVCTAISGLAATSPDVETWADRVADLLDVVWAGHFVRRSAA